MKRPIDELKRDIVFPAHLPQGDFVFHSTWGLFSPTAVDDGSRLLLESVEVVPAADILDLGCGYGVIGVALGRMAPHGHIDLTDTNATAVAFAEKNLIANNITNGRAFISNGFETIAPDARYDLIVSNLPAKVGRELYDIFFADAKKHLKPNGRLVVVTIAGLKEYIKREFREVFGNYDKLRQGKAHIVAMAVKQSHQVVAEA